MSGSWQVKYDGTIDGRRIRVEARDGSAFMQVLTTQVEHEEGIAYQDGGHFVHVSPSDRGEMVESEVGSIDDLPTALAQLHFPERAVAQIMAALKTG